MTNPLTGGTASMVVALTILVSACSGGTEQPDQEPTIEESGIASPVIGGALPDPFAVIDEVADPMVGESEQNTSASAPEMAITEETVAVESTMDLPETDENGIPYCD